MGDEARQGKLNQELLVGGFKGGWRAAMETVAGQLQQALDAIAKAGEDPAEYAVNVSDLLKGIRSQADHAPTPATVQVRPGESREAAMARATRPVIGNAAPPTRRGPVPSLEEALPNLAWLLAAEPAGADIRTKRAQWVAIVGFAMFTRDCAAADGIVPELDREAARVRDYLAGLSPFPLPTTGPLASAGAKA